MRFYKHQSHRHRANQLHFETLETRRLLAADAFEPNETLPAASPLSAGSQVVSNLTIHQEGDDDYYSWPASVNGTLQVDLLFSHAMGDLDLVVFDSGGTELASSDSITDNERVKVSIVNGQSYVIYAFDASGGSNVDYSLQLTEIAPDALEPNDSAGTAHDLGSTTPMLMDLTLHSASTDDFYKFTAPSAGNLLVDAVFAHSDGDVDLQLLNSSQNVIDVSDSSGNGEQVSASLGAGDMVFIRVFGADGATTKDYGLNLTFGAPPDLASIGMQTTQVSIPKTLTLSVNDADTPLSALSFSGGSSNQTLVPDGNISFDTSGPDPLMTITPVFGQSGLATITVDVEDPEGGSDSESFLLVVAGQAPPNVATFRIGSTNWQHAGFLDEIDPALGIGHPVTNLDPLPWINLDQVHVTFVNSVTPAIDDLTIKGVNTAEYTPSAFSYEASTKTATWTLPENLAADKLLLTVNPVLGGANSQIRADILPGDTTQNGIVLGSDVGQVRLAQFSQPGDANYLPKNDVDGSGIVLGSDVGAVRLRQFSMLPGGEPVVSPIAFQLIASTWAVVEDPDEEEEAAQ